MELRRSDWAELVDDMEHGGVLVSIFALANEHHPDPEMRPYKEPMRVDRREQLIVSVAASIPQIYRYFASQWRFSAQMQMGEATYRRPVEKVGRNELCPCGTGKKYKKCCGAMTLH